MKRKNLGKRMTILATVSALTVGCIPMNVFAYGDDVTVDNATFRNETDSSEDYQTWKADVWDAGESADSGKIALTPGDTEEDLNFAWYSETRGLQPAVKVWKVGKEDEAQIVKGTSTIINASNAQGSTYEAYNHVSVEGFFKADTKYQYQYADDYNGDYTVWSEVVAYNTADTTEFSVIVTGDPQVGASGSSGQGTADDKDIARDTYNWNKTMEAAGEKYPDAALLLSVGDQVDWHTADTEAVRQIRESEYAGYLYPSIFRSLPIAATIGNHDTMGADYSYHFNNPNSEENLGATAAGSDFYFSYGDVLFICLNSNNRNQAEHRTLMTEAVENNPDAKWRVAYFHADIYGSGTGHSDTDATGIRIVLAPLMDEFDIDICLTGHDHTYSRSYQILDGNVIEYDIADGSITNPEGTLYVSTGSGSGSKYYNFVNYTQYYIADRTNVCLPTFSALEFTEDSMTVKTYDYNGEQYADDFTIVKTDSEASVKDVITSGEEKLADSEKEYTTESLAALKSAVDKLKEIQASYTTAVDPMVEILTKYYNTPDDRCVATGVVRVDGKVDGLGYGHVYSSEDKDNGANRFKQGISTLLDKTVYIQNFTDEVNENLPIVKGAQLEEAKTEVLEAIANLKVVVKEEESTTVKNPSPDKDELESTTPKGEGTTTSKEEESTTSKEEESTTSKEEESTTSKEEETTSTTVSKNEVMLDEAEVEKLQKSVEYKGVAEGVELKLETITPEVLETVKEAVKEILKNKVYVAVNISLYNATEKVQANGNVEITMDVPSELTSSKMIQVYRIGDDNKLVKVSEPVKVENGRFTFTTNHFSTYIFADATDNVTEETTTDAITTPGQTGDNSNVWILVSAMLIAAGVGVMAFRKKEEECETR